jgi:cytidine deaminase
VDDGTRELFEAALAAYSAAYAPYSGFSVGAAVRDESGRVHVGCNVENASYPEGTCAEAGAIAAMALAGGRRIVEVVTVAGGALVTTCCGGCRQRLREFTADDVLVHAAGPDGVRATFTMSELLPASFGTEQLDVQT